MLGIRRMVMKFILDRHCGFFGHYNPRSHICIRGVEECRHWCLKCKEAKCVMTMIEQLP